MKITKLLILLKVIIFLLVLLLSKIKKGESPLFNWWTLADDFGTFRTRALIAARIFDLNIEQVGETNAFKFVAS